MRVLLIGAGNYGNLKVGRKYALGVFGVKLSGVVDPKIDEIKNGVNYCMQGIPTYHSLEVIPRKLLQDVIADVALIPQIVPKVFGQIANLGIKKVILPKPVAVNYDDYKMICSIAEENNMQALVASNWHYSDITKNLRSLVKRVTTGNFGTPADKQITRNLENVGYDIDRISVEYSKKDEKLDIDPPLQELPHALQILLSAELVKKLKSVRTVLPKHLQSRSRVNLSMTNVEGVRNGIIVNSDLKSGDKLLGQNRVRKVVINLDQYGQKGKIIADYDAVFDAEGRCKKYPEIIYEFQDGETVQQVSYVIKEDNINKMYEEIFKAMSGKENNALTIDGYKPLAQYMSSVEKKWLENV